MFWWNVDVPQAVLLNMQLNEVPDTRVPRVAIIAHERMSTGPLFVLVDGEPADSGLVRAAREYADANACSITLLRVLPEVTRAFRADRGVVILPERTMLAMKAYAKRHLEKLKEDLLRGRARPTRTLVRFGDVMDEVARTSDAQQAQAVMARSRVASFLPWRSRDRLLQRKLRVPVILLDGANGLLGAAADEATAVPLNVSDKVQAINHVPAFACLSRKELAAVARNLDEAHIDAGTTVVVEGRSNHAFWIVLEGELNLTVRGKLLERVTPPGLVGAPSMLDGRPAWATVTAVTPVSALVASRAQFGAICADDRVAVRLWAETGTRLRHHILDSMSEAG
jgi:CRP-like cAMP-binding protein